MTFGESYGDYGGIRRPTAAALESYPSSCAEESLLVNEDEEDCSSGASTPPLWRTTDCPASTVPPARQGTGNENHYQSLSPASRAQAIARGQRELMEMVSRMPEGCYELSLKDLVEHQLQIGIDPEDREEKFPERNSIHDGGEIGRNLKLGKKKKSDISEKSYNPAAAAKMTRSGSLENGGFMLKMGCPVYFLRSRSKKKKKKQGKGKGGSAASFSGGSPKDGRVSPRPLLVNGSSGPAAVGKIGGGGKAAESCWWKDGCAVTVEAEAGESCESAAGFSSSSNSNNSHSSKSSRGSNGSRHGGNSGRNSDRRRSGLSCLSLFSSKGKVAE
ncbi:unnamed protein product [Linum trigynum]|uniref:Uncharacterized protein n=1 Tax=Linum trigynum TaxID=586398 RepID=A0AAV2GQI7_9ROSI